MVAATLALALALQVPPEPGAEAPPQPLGREVYVKHCVLCHRVGAEGHDYGPDLSDAGLRLTLEQVRESILAPSKSITAGYEMVQVDLRDGPPQVGILAPQSAGKVLLRQQGGVVLRFEKAQVARVVPLKTSAMTDLTRELRPGDVDAVAAYVLAQRSPRPKPPVAPLPPAHASDGAPPWLLWLALGSTLLLLAIVVMRKGRGESGESVERAGSAGSS